MKQGKSNYWDIQPSRKQDLKELYNHSIENGWFPVVYIGGFAIYTILLWIFADKIGSAIHYVIIPNGLH
jgi:hypothetical protein